MEENKLKTIEGELEAPADFTSPDVLYRDLVASIRKYHPSDDLSMIEKAYQLADNAHKIRGTVHYPSALCGDHPCGSRDG